MTMRNAACLSAIIGLLALTGHAAALDVALSSPQIKNADDLRAVMYTQLGAASDACVRLLNADGTVGCAAPSAAALTGRLMALPSAAAPAESLPHGTVALVPASEAGAFLSRCLQEPELQSRLTGVLIEHPPGGAWPGWNAASKAPDGAVYPWNPPGTGLALQNIPFPVFQLDNVTSANAAARAAYNAQTDGGAANVARMELTMEASGNSSACVAAKSCYPLGGNSVWGALPPLGPDATPDRPVIVVTAQVDSLSLFHRLTKSADAPLSGLVATLAAAAALGGAANADAVEQLYVRRLIFLAVSGEPWDYMGSRRLLWEVSQGTAAVAGLGPLDDIEALIEVGQVGKAQKAGSGAFQMYAHAEKEGAAGAAAAPLQAALIKMGDASVAVDAPSATIPGLPPSTVSSFLRQRPDLPAVSLQEFDTAFLNGPYRSEYDTAEGIDPGAIAAAAEFLARALHSLAISGTTTATTLPPPLNLNATAIRERVDALLDCLARDVPGMGCELVSSMMSPADTGPAPAYVGILRTVAADPQTPDANVQSDVERFLWTYLANVTARDAAEAPPCSPANATDACAAGTVCAGYRDIKGPDGAGKCLNATVRYVPAYSTGLACAGCDGSATYYDYLWQVTDAANEWEKRYGWPPDPMWTESNWPSSTPSLEMFLQDSAAVEYAALGVGLAVTAVAVAVAGAARLAWRKRQKQD